MTNVNESSTYRLRRPLADIRIESLTKEKENFIYLVNMAENEEWEAQDVIEDDEHFDPLLDDVAIYTAVRRHLWKKTWIASQGHKTGFEA